MNIFLSSFRFKVESGVGSGFLPSWAGSGSMEKNVGSSSLWKSRRKSYNWTKVVVVCQLFFSCIMCCISLSCQFVYYEYQGYGPGGLYPDLNPDPKFERKPNPDPTFEKNIRIQPNFFTIQLPFYFFISKTIQYDCYFDTVISLW